MVLIAPLQIFQYPLVFVINYILLKHEKNKHINFLLSFYSTFLTIDI